MANADANYDEMIRELIKYQQRDENGVPRTPDERYAFLVKKLEQLSKDKYFKGADDLSKKLQAEWTNPDARPDDLDNWIRFNYTATIAGLREAIDESKKGGRRRKTKKTKKSKKRRFTRRR